jgi:phospholipid/cholesterol/gamma-HCH transport system ATP-binding protein
MPSPDSKPGDDPGAKPRPLIHIRGLRFAYGARPIFDGIDLDIHRGRVTAIIGPSGSGKTTLLRLIGGQLRPAGGTVEFDGVDVHALGWRDLFKLRQRMGMQFQTQALLTDLSVLDNIAFPLREHTGLPESMIRDVVLMKLQTVGLRGARDLFPEELSGGMSRRVALARAIALDPDLVMYDEPFAGQDPITLGVLMRLIRALNDALGLSSIVVSHSVEEVLAIADDVFVVSELKVLERGTPDAIKRSNSAYVQQLLTGKAEGPVKFHYPAPPMAQDVFGTA